jgi:PAS domain S-box-containing protein
MNKKVEKAVNVDSGHLDTILNCIAEGVFTVDREKKITFFNKAAERITGFSAKDAVGQYCRDIFRTACCSTCCTMDEVERENRTVANRQVKILDRNGNSVLVSISAALLRDNNGVIIGGVETFRDMTAETALRRQIEKNYTFQDIISRDPVMHEIFAILPDIAESSVSVLIEGDSGTGKELLARAIHNIGTRKNNPFIAVNCASLPDTLLESELFGYKKGAFTDARRDKAGRFEMAGEGTLFLDEIGDISPALQVRLLRVLQEKTYEPLGATVPSISKARILAATNKKLLSKVHDGSFREDLYYRLNVLKLELPPLAERMSDVPLLVENFRNKLNAETGKNIEAVDDDVMDLLMQYNFPGNIRELENIMQHAFVLCRDSVIQYRHLPADLRAGFGNHDEKKAVSLADREKKAILEALSMCDNNRTAAAGMLGINPSTLYRKMKRYGMKSGMCVC